MYRDLAVRQALDRNDLHVFVVLRCPGHGSAIIVQESLIKRLESQQCSLEVSCVQAILLALGLFSDDEDMVFASWELVED